MLADAIQSPAAAQSLLAIRRAGAPLDDAWSLRNERFERLVAERDELLRELASRRQPLVDALYAQVPLQPTRGARRGVLTLKRDLFNGRSPGPIGEVAVLPDDLRQRIGRYRDLFERSEQLLDQGRSEVLDASRERLAALLLDRGFRLALRFASPDLAAALERGSSALRSPDVACAPRFSTLERGLYSYASRFATKANPLHLFASVQVESLMRAGTGAPETDVPESDAPATTGSPAGSHLTVHFEPEGLLTLERRLLANGDAEAGPGASEPPRLHRLALPPSARIGDFCVFFHAGRDGVELRRVPWSEGLDRLLSLVGRGAAETMTRSTLVTRLEQLDDSSRSAVTAALHALEAEGVVAYYVLPDLVDAAPLWDAARSSGLLAADLAESARRLHFARLDVAALDDVSSTLDALASKAGLRSKVNAYHAGDASFAHQAADAVAADLEALKPAFFAAGHNFSHHQAVLRAFVVESLESHGGSAPYLEVLTRFLVDRRGIIARYQPARCDDVARSLAEAARWRSRLGRLDGSIEASDLQQLLAEAPRTAREVEGRSLCVNGVWDADRGLFTVSNLFDGDGHFASRFHLGAVTEADRSSADLREVAAPDDRLEVELAVPPVPSINFVAPSRPVGFGFEPRFSHRYSHWVDPTDIELVLDAGVDGERRVGYRQRSTGRRLRFIYRGYLLGQLLPAEWQLLRLDGQGDSFHNPFDRLEALRPEPVAVAADAAEAGDASGPRSRHDCEVVYGSLRLRRESWSLGAALLRQAPSSDEPVEFALELRDWLHGLLQRDRETVAERWYYHATGTADGAYKPRFLDLRNPLSSHAFRRRLQAVVVDGAETAALRFTAVDPPPERWHDGRVHELMIEV